VCLEDRRPCLRPRASARWSGRKSSCDRYRSQSSQNNTDERASPPPAPAQIQAPPGDCARKRCTKDSAHSRARRRDISIASPIVDTQPTTSSTTAGIVVAAAQSRLRFPESCLKPASTPKMTGGGFPARPLTTRTFPIELSFSTWPTPAIVLPVSRTPDTNTVNTSPSVSFPDFFRVVRR